MIHIEIRENNTLINVTFLLISEDTVVAMKAIQVVLLVPPVQVNRVPIVLRICWYVIFTLVLAVFYFILSSQ